MTAVRSSRYVRNCRVGVAKPMLRLLEHTLGVGSCISVLLATDEYVVDGVSETIRIEKACVSPSYIV